MSNIFSTSDYIYYILLTVSIVFSLIDKHEAIRGIIYLRILLIVALLVELANDFVDYYTPYGNIAYHFYIPAENMFLALFFYTNLKINRRKKIILLISFFYALFFLSYSFYYNGFMNYPSLFYNIHCIIIICWSLLSLMNLEFIGEVKLVKNPIFLLSSGFLIFYSGIFFFNGTYNYFIKHNLSIANSLRTLINVNLNFLLYIIWSYSFICSIQLKKYYTQQ